MTLIESEQSKDIQLTQIARGPFLLRFASYRKGEDAKLELRSEDYIVSELTPEHTIFGLCDGVGSSYYGNIGSQFLGETIRNWLGKVSVPSSSVFAQANNANLWLEELNNDLKNELDDKAVYATSVIKNRKITSQGELIQLAEKTQRDDFGTQSNFAGGIIWPKTNDLPNGLVLLFWLGNARVRIFNKLEENKFEELTHLTRWGDNPEQLKEVWSSKDGVVGNVYSYSTDFSRITTVIAYSDGLEGVEEEITPDIQGVKLESLIHQAQTIKDDDVSYLEISLAKGAVDEYSDDIVSAIRNQYAFANSPVVSDSQLELQELNKRLYRIEEEKKEQSRKLQKTLRDNKILTVVLLLFALSTILLTLGYFIGGTTEVEITPTFTSLPTFTPIPPSITPATVPSLLPSPPINQVTVIPNTILEYATQAPPVISVPSLAPTQLTSMPVTPPP